MKSQDKGRESVSQHVKETEGASHRVKDMNKPGKKLKGLGSGDVNRDPRKATPAVAE